MAGSLEETLAAERGSGGRLRGSRQEAAAAAGAQRERHMAGLDQAAAAAGRGGRDAKCIADVQSAEVVLHAETCLVSVELEIVRLGCRGAVHQVLVALTEDALRATKFLSNTELTAVDHDLSAVGLLFCASLMRPFAAGDVKLRQQNCFWGADCCQAFEIESGCRHMSFAA